MRIYICYAGLQYGITSVEAVRETPKRFYLNKKTAVNEKTGRTEDFFFRDYVDKGRSRIKTSLKEAQEYCMEQMRLERANVLNELAEVEREIERLTKQMEANDA